MPTGGYGAMPTAFATDMTLILGAESSLLQSEFPPDPLAGVCLQAFVDLFLNSDSLHLILPSADTDQGVPRLVTGLGEHVSTLPRGAIHLDNRPEKEVFNGFVHLVNKQLADPKEREAHWLLGWLRFQLMNPIVTAGHRHRIHERGEQLISDSGYTMWQDQCSRLLNWSKTKKLLAGDDLVTSASYAEQVAEYRRHESRPFKSHNEFVLCYAFDVYRRGWQYAAAVSGADPKPAPAYIPHYLRDVALEAGSSKWDRIKAAQTNLWSWGAYILNLVGAPEYPHERSTERVIDHILAIREAMRGHLGCPTWSVVPALDPQGQWRMDDAFLRELRYLHERVEDIASKAHLPRLKLRDESRSLKFVQAVGPAVGTTTIAIGLDLLLPSPIFSISAALIQLGGTLTYFTLKQLAPDRVGRIEENTTSLEREVVNWFHKGRFGYPGLITTD